MPHLILLFATGSVAACSKPDPYIEIKALEELYARDEAGADRAYASGIQVRGVVDSVTKGELPGYGLMLESDGILPVATSIIRADWERAARAQTGQKVELSCRKLSQILGKVILTDCHIDRIDS